MSLEMDDKGRGDSLGQWKRVVEQQRYRAQKMVGSHRTYCSQGTSLRLAMLNLLEFVIQSNENFIHLEKRKRPSLRV